MGDSSMTGDFSIIRLSKEKERQKNYKKVLLQQGRVLTDADWNDQADIQDNHDTRSLRDIIGKNGIPLEQKEDSFKIRPLGGNRYSIGKGRIYVDGILVENFSEVQGFSDKEGTVRGQPYLPTLFDQDQPISDAVPKEPGTYMAYLDVWNRHITQLEDADIQESALGGLDTTTRVQNVWQVKLHKLEDGEPINANESEEDKWLLPTKNLGTFVLIPFIRDIKVGSNKDGSLEVFTIDLSANNKFRSIRQIPDDIDNWEAWKEDPQNQPLDRIEVASNSDGLLELFGIFTNPIENISSLLQNSKLEDSNWSGWKVITFRAREMAIGKNKDGSLELIWIVTADLGGHIRHRKQKSVRSEWEPAKVIGDGNEKFTKLSVITNPINNCIELYAIEETSGKIFFTRQAEPDSSNWLGWTQMNQDNPLQFDQVVAGINRNKQSIIFSSDRKQRGIWSTIRSEPSSPQGNGWNKVGNTIPGKLIIVDSSSQSVMSVQNHKKKGNRLELFAILSDSEPRKGSIWTIHENEDGLWSSEWTLIEGSSFVEVSSRTDNMSRLNIFARHIEFSQFANQQVRYTYFEDALATEMCTLEIPSWNLKIKPSTWQLKARTRPQPPLPDDPCLLPEQAGYRRLENQLYRIEIHEPKSPAKNATFKYSRDNGTICSKIVNISGQKITVASMGRDRLLGFKSGQWIEIKDDLRELWGMPGVLVRVIGIEGTDLVCDMDTLIPETAKIDNDSFPQNFNPKVTRWDSLEDSPGVLDVEIPTENKGWIEIEDGIEVKFNNIDVNDICKTADHITIPARSLKADIEWPKTSDGQPEFVDIEGIDHHYVKLAFLEYSESGDLMLISDCRDFFPPLNTLDDLSPQPQKPEPKLITSWTHGTISQVQSPDRLLDGRALKEGFGTTYLQRFNELPDVGINWFHFPTTNSYPLHPDKKITIQKIYVLYSTNDGPKISDIFIYDGSELKKELTNLSRSGNHSSIPDESNTFILEPEIEMKQAIGISIRVSFLEGSPDRVGMVTFNSVGVQLKID
jgi:hypothetical protein